MFACVLFNVLIFRLQPTAVQFFTYVALLYTHVTCAVVLGMSIGASVSTVQMGQLLAPLIIVRRLICSLFCTDLWIGYFPLVFRVSCQH